MKSSSGVGDDAAVLPRVLAHYRLTAPAIESSLGGTPIVFRNFPAGLERDGIFHPTVGSVDGDQAAVVHSCEVRDRVLHVGAFAG